MSLSDHLSQLAGALEQTRGKLSEVCQKIDDLRHQRLAIVNAKPHADDIIDSLMRSVDAQAQAFESALKSNLAEVFVASDTAAQSVTGAPVNVLGVEATRPDAMKLSDRQSRGIAPPINLGALAFLLWDRLADEVPNLVDRLCPNSRSGMKSADRKQALDKLNADLAALEAERDTLQGELHAARQVVANGQGY